MLIHKSKHFVQEMQKCTAHDKATENMNAQRDDDHRLTLRIPRWLLEKIDVRRKERVGTISRNLWILERLEDAI